MASKGLQAISYQGRRKVEAGYKPSHTNETLIGYTALAFRWLWHSFINLSQSILYQGKTQMSTYIYHIMSVDS